MKGIFFEQVRRRKHYAHSCGSAQALIRLHLHGLAQASLTFSIHISEYGWDFWIGVDAFSKKSKAHLVKDFRNHSPNH
jgi:hypothetical protein